MRLLPDPDRFENRFGEFESETSRFVGSESGFKKKVESESAKMLESLRIGSLTPGPTDWGTDGNCHTVLLYAFGGLPRVYKQYTALLQHSDRAPILPPTRCRLGTA